MTIKEIAEMAGVSISTVSKIINKKDEHITPETRERVLRIVKEYHYTPYGDMLAAQSGRKFLLGVMYDIDNGNDRILSGLIREAGKRGYSIIVTTNSTPEDEFRSLEVLRSHQVDGLIWIPIKGYQAEQEERIAESGLPYQIMDFRRRCDYDNACFDYWEIGYRLTQMLLEKHHRRILCMLEIHGMRAEMMFQGYRQCLFDHQIPYSESYLAKWDDPSVEEPADLSQYTAVLCFNLRVARRVFNLAERKGIDIPLDLSVVTVGSGESGENLEEVSLLGRPLDQLAKFVVGRLVAEIEGQAVARERFRMNFQFNHQHSIEIARSIRSRRILVFGAAAMETVIKMQEGGRTAEPVRLAESHREIPGGKALRQVIAAAGQGADCFFLGRVGRDPAGRKLYNSLSEKNIHLDGLITDAEAETVRAYTIQEGAKSRRIYYGERTHPLTEEELTGKRTLFRYCQYCLLQGEIAQPLLSLAADLAHEQGAGTIVRLSGTEQAGKLQKGQADILVLGAFSRHPASDEEMLEMSRNTGGTVISVDHKVCRWAADGILQTTRTDRPETRISEDATDFFTAALACRLSEGVKLPEAIVQAAESL